MLRSIFQVILPRSCLLCQSKVHAKYDLCQACENDLPYLDNVCAQCALPLDATHSLSICGQCQTQPPPFDATHALFHYKPPLTHLIPNFKFKHHLVYGAMLSQLMTLSLQKYYQTKPLPTLIIPAPLHPSRLRQRGFNQSLELARPIAYTLKLELNYKSVKRVRDTNQQMNIPAKLRKKNVAQAFQLIKPLNTDHIALIDDVMTTGHTVRSLALALRHAGIKRIDVWCIARAHYK